ncbi:MAG: D-2-hydroxyacid dehydrogenase [Spirochaetales bacterium]|nr:D-2-hydroxyacid dehydrogenase [Spirochaetales bacterium]
MNIVILDAASLGSDMDLSVFSELGSCRIWQNTEPHELEQRIRDCHIIITNRVILGEKELSFAPSLRMIALTATGFNTIDLERCRQRDIAVANVTSYSTGSVAQHTFAMLLYLLEQTRYYDDYVRQGKFREDRRFADVSRPWYEISGKRWGIIGLGTIGRKVATLAEAFGAEVVYFSTSGVDRVEAFRSVSLDELCRSSDIISIHAPLNQQTCGLLGETEFNMMKKSSLLINAGRGAIVNEKALSEALSAGSIRGAALDVLCDEPPSEDNPLLPLIGEKLLITPHNAWGSIESRSRLINEVFENIKAFQKDEKRNRIL